MADAKSMFGSLKEKLGQLGTDSRNHSTSYEDDYDEYEEYDEEYDSYEEEDPGYSTRSVRGSRSSFDSIGLPNLVSRSDAEESTRSRPSSLSGTSRSTRTMVDSSLPPSMTPEGTAAVSAARNRRSEGLDSLFSSTTSAPRTNATSVLGASQAGGSVAGSRSLQVIRPVSYEDAEGVTRALKVGDVAVLVLTGVPEGLVHRMLDFSFGAASALDASVECVADRTFVLNRGEALSDAERLNLSTLGVLS